MRGTILIVAAAVAAVSFAYVMGYMLYETAYLQWRAGHTGDAVFSLAVLAMLMSVVLGWLAAKK